MRKEKYRLSNEEFLEEDVFVPTDLGPGLDIKKDNRSDAVILWVIGVLTAGALLWLFTKNGIKEATSIPDIFSLCIYMVLSAVIGCYCIAKFIYKADEKVSVRSAEGTAIHNTSIGEVCNISAGGLSIEEFDKNISGLVINFQGCPALVYSTINGSTDGLVEGAVEAHYAALEKIIDEVASRRYSQYRYTLRYDTANDKIWDHSAAKVYNVADELGEGYVRIMRGMLEHMYDYTVEHSQVVVKYSVIKFNNNATINDIATMYNTIKNYTKSTVATVKLLNFKEFQSLLQSYYCRIHLDLNRVIPKASYEATEGDSWVISLKSKDKVKDVKPPTEVKIADNFFDNIYTEVYEPTEDVYRIIEKLDIFSD